MSARRDGVDDEALVEMTPSEQRRVIRAWFLQRYEPPTDSLPIDMKDPTGFAWVNSHAYDAEDVIRERFEALVQEDVLLAVAEGLNSEAIDWRSIRSESDEMRPRDDGFENLFPDATRRELRQVRRLLNSFQFWSASREQLYSDRESVPGTKIEDIRERIAALREELDRLARGSPPKSTAPGIGHNGGPKPEADLQRLDGIGSVIETNLTADLVQLSAAIEQPKPDLSAIRRVSSSLLNASAAIALWIVRKGDKAVETLITAATGDAVIGDPAHLLARLVHLEAAVSSFIISHSIF